MSDELDKKNHENNSISTKENSPDELNHMLENMVKIENRLNEVGQFNFILKQAVHECEESGNPTKIYSTTVACVTGMSKTVYTCDICGMQPSNEAIFGITFDLNMVPNSSSLCQP